MRAALIGTIWLALAGFVAGEHGKTRRAPWALGVWTAGAVLCAVHIAIAFVAVHGGSRAAMVAATARQTASVYGLDWGGGAYVNFVFLACWLAEAAWWSAAPAAYGRRPRWMAWLVGAFYFVVILNGAVIFARGPARLAGLALVGAWLPALVHRSERV